MEIIKVLRQIPPLNHFGRVTLKRVITLTRKLEQLALGWRISGVVSLNYLGISFKLFSNSDDTIAGRIYYGLPWEDAEAKLLLSLVKKSRVVFDVGANSGVFSILGAKDNPQALVYSFEPNPVNFERLVKNVELNDLGNVRPIEAAVGASDGQVSFNIQSGTNLTETSSVVTGFAKSFSGGKTKQVNVGLVSLDSFIRQEKVKPDLIKIDVEYYEQEVLSGAKAYLAKHKPVVMCEVLIYEVIKVLYPRLAGNIDPTHSYKIEQFFSELGYYFYLIGADGLMRVETLHANPDGKNYLFSPKKSRGSFVPYRNPEQLVREVMP